MSSLNILSARLLDWITLGIHFGRQYAISSLHITPLEFWLASRQFLLPSHATSRLTSYNTGVNAAYRSLIDNINTAYRLSLQLIKRSVNLMPGHAFEFGSIRRFTPR